MDHLICNINDLLSSRRCEIRCYPEYKTWHPLYEYLGIDQSDSYDLLRMQIITDKVGIRCRKVVINVYILFLSLISPLLTNHRASELDKVAKFCSHQILSQICHTRSMGKDYPTLPTGTQIMRKTKLWRVVFPLYS